MSTHKVLVYHPDELSELGAHVVKFFEADVAVTKNDFLNTLGTKPYKVVVMDAVHHASLNIEICEDILALKGMADIPFIVLTQSVSLDDKLKALEIGCDDFIESRATGDEACARITKSIFNRIANDQLAKRLELATDAAHSAMVDNSDLGANLQFLLSVHSCDNLDQLGQQFFQVIERYGLKCSLQMRSIMGDKNMEAHGMAKDLETQLLSQMADSDRYIDFGRRTICNYENVSLLIKNMPVDDPEKYGAIKDNTFCLVQGLNARIHALEDQHRIQKEKDALAKLSQDVNSVMHSLKDSYQDVMRDIVNSVEHTSSLIQNRVPHLALMEHDEAFLEDITSSCVKDTNRIFNEGLVIDEVFQKLETAISRTLDNVDSDSTLRHASNQNDKDAGEGSSIELF